MGLKLREFTLRGIHATWVTSFVHFTIFILTQVFLPNRRSNAAADSALLPDKELAVVKVGASEGGGGAEGEVGETVKAVKNDRGRADPEEASQSGYNHSAG